MLYALLLLGLIPVVLLPEYLAKDEEPIDMDEHETMDPQGEDLLAEPVSLDPIIEDDEPGDQTDPDEGVIPPTVDDDIGETVLAPVIENDQPSDPNQPPPEDIRAPVDENDAPPDPDAQDPNDVLAPVIEDDFDATLDPILEDDMAPEEYHFAYTGEPADIMGFDALEDVLVVRMLDSEPDATLDTTVDVSENGQDSLVHVDGALVAVIRDEAGVALDQIQIEIGDSV